MIERRLAIVREDCETCEEGPQYLLVWRLSLGDPQTGEAYVAFVDALEGGLMGYHNATMHLTGYVDAKVWLESPGVGQTTQDLAGMRYKRYNAQQQEIGTGYTGTNGSLYYTESTARVVADLGRNFISQTGSRVKVNSGSTTDDGLSNEIEYDAGVFSWVFPDDATSSGPDSVKQEEVNVYYHMDKFHRYWKLTHGFTKSQVKAYVRSGSSVAASAYGDTVISFGSSSAGDYAHPQHARDSDAIKHEYTHTVIHQIFGNSLGSLGCLRT